MFEGGTNTYNNWVELSAGAFLTKGSQAQAEQNHRLNDGVFGGIEDLHFQQNVATNTTFSLDGRALFDNHDYRLTLGLKRENLGYVRVNFQNFRTWYDGNGGFYRPGDIWYPLSDDALVIDRGEISFEAGLTMKNLPKITFKYSHLYREGDKSSTSWGFTHPLLNAPMPDSTLVRGLAPTFYNLDETRDIFELDATHHIKTTDFGVGLRYETSDLDNSRKITQWPGESIERKITDREGTTYDMFSVHAFTETWLKKNLFFSSGFLFANIDTDFSGSRIYGDDFDVGYAPNMLNGLGYYNLDGVLHKQEYVLNLNLMSTPIPHLTIVPSIRVQKEDWDADSSGIGTLGTATGPFSANSDRDLLDIRERLDLRYTGVTNWVLYASGEWTEGDGNLQEIGGLSRINNIGVAPIQRKTEDSRFFQKYTVGARWYPSRSVTVDFGGYYKLNNYDYDHPLDDTSNTDTNANRYPAYLVMQNFETYDGNVRLTMRPWKNVTLVSRYEYQLSTIHTQPDPVSGLSDVESSEMTSHIFGQNISWVPCSRLSLQVGGNYVVSKTETPTSRYTQAVLDSQNNYWTVNFNSTVVLDNKTDLNVGYFYYQSDDYLDNSDVGLPLGAEATEHGVTATITRRLTQSLRLNLRYGFFHYEDTPSGGNDDYEAHVLFSSLQYRF
jgi:hypothetical protein